MKEVYKIAEFDPQGNLKLKMEEFSSYPDAVAALDEQPSGVYQIQKVFVK